MLSEATREATQNALNAFVAKSVELAGPALRKIILFGSWARDEATDESDVDVLVVLDEDRALRNAIRTVSADLGIDTGVIITLVFRLPRQYARQISERTSFMQYIGEEGITLYDHERS